MDPNKLYRVTAKKTGSIQPCETYWNREVLYCGYDREAARQAYHESTPHDHSAGMGNPARRTILEVILDAATDDFADDLWEVE